MYIIILPIQIPTGGYTRLTVMDRIGRVIKTLLDKDVSPDYYSVSWDGKDEHGQPLPSGIYFVKLSQGKLEFTRRIILLK